jgi:hypothetical protein
MAQRGNSPKPDPFSECPNPECRRKFLASVERCPFCKLKRGDLEKRGEKCETRTTPRGEASVLLNKLIQQLPPEKRSEVERIRKEQKRGDPRR